jgi:hypothetical protein
MRTFIALALLLTGCAASPRPAQIVGRYSSRLSEEDLRQIQSVAVGGGHLALQKVDAFEPSRVRVETGAETSFVKFTLMKRHGRWLIDNSAEATANIERSVLVH